MEKDLERQRLLEIERARTRELRHMLDMEKERQTQVITGKNPNFYYNKNMQHLLNYLWKAVFT